MAETYYCQNCKEIVAQGHDCERLQKIRAFQKPHKKKKRNNVTPTPLRSKEKEKKMEITKEQIKEVFIKWEKMHQEDPDRFETEHSTPEKYGEACAEFFIKLLNE